jgi:DNA-3-methyladenine glycosylase
LTLAHAFYDRAVLEVAPALLGCVVRHGDTAGVIVETEAYHQSEPACHAYVGLTARTSTLFGPPGRAYVYRSYGIHALLNAVCEPRGVGAAVLIRALEPLDGLALMQRRRVAGGAPCHRVTADTICQGPGNLSVAMGITLAQNLTDLTGATLYLEDRGLPALEIAWSSRIGIRVGTEQQWRAVDARSRAITGRAPRAITRIRR